MTDLRNVNIPGTFAQIIVVPICLKVSMQLTSALSGLEIFAGSSYRGSICCTRAKVGSSYREFREIEGSRNRG